MVSPSSVTGAAFPPTQVSAVAALSSDDAEQRERALALVVGTYRAPVIAVVRRRWNLDEADAEDLAHDFFAEALEKGWFARFEPRRGRFRTFVRQCLFAFASTAYERASRQKRGGHLVPVALDGLAGTAMNDAIDLHAISAAPEVDAVFDAEWRRSVLTLALQALEAECAASDRELTWRVFAAHDLDGADADAPPSYAILAERFAVPRTQVTNYLNWARRRFRGHVLDALRALTASDEEFRDEARALLGAGADCGRA